MKNIIIALVLIAGFFIFKNFLGDDQKAINNLLLEIEESLEYQTTLPPLSVLSRLKVIQSHLSSDFSASSFNDGKTRTLDDLSKVKEHALVATRYFSNIDIFRVPSIIKVSGKSAKTTFHVTISGKDAQGVAFKELFSVTMEFSKQSNSWLCSSIQAERLTPES